MKSVIALLVTAHAVSPDFDTYKATFGKTYASDAEEAVARRCWSENVEKITQHQSINSMATFGENKFTDQCSEEFLHERTMGDYMQQMNGVCTMMPKPSYDGAVDMDKDVDWVKEGYVTPVKDQGHCGSCWSFSATGCMEGQHFKKTGELVAFSEQELVDCDKLYDMGCSGGGPDTAWAWVKAQGGGIASEDDYPYVSGTSGKRQQCNQEAKAKIAGKFTGTRYISDHNETQVLAALQNEGPISITVYAAGLWQHYTGGIVTDCQAPVLLGTDHAVLAVGYGKENGVPYWLVKNSWGPDWGENGYIRIAHGKNQCNVANFMSYVVTAADAEATV